MEEQWKALQADVASVKSTVMNMATQLTGLHSKAFPLAEKKPGNAEPKKKSEEEPKDPVANWLLRKGLRRAG